MKRYLVLLVIPTILFGQDKPIEREKILRPDAPTHQPPSERAAPDRKDRPSDTPTTRPDISRPTPPPPIRPIEPGVRPTVPPAGMGRPPINIDPWGRCTPIDRWNCRPPLVLEMQFPQRSYRRNRPSRLEMAPLTEKQRIALRKLRVEYRKKRQRILNTP